MKKDFVKPILSLMLICLVMSAALAFTNSATAPVIEKNAQERAAAARKEIIPEADDFVLIDSVKTPETVDEIYVSTNGVGYIFTVTETGYGGDVKIMCGIGEDGRIIATKVLKHSETKGIGSKVTETPFSEQFVGKDKNLEDVSAITGATRSSSAYIRAVEVAFEAFRAVKEAGQ